MINLKQLRGVTFWKQGHHHGRTGEPQGVVKRTKIWSLKLLRLWLALVLAEALDKSSSFLIYKIKPIKMVISQVFGRIE